MLSLSKSEIKRLKKEAAEKGIEWLTSRFTEDSHLVVGAGSGTTVAYAFPGLKKFDDLIAVPTSRDTRDRLEELDLPTGQIEDYEKLNFDIDGADEVDPNFNLIKGGGGCHYREKRVASKSELFAVVVDQRKLVDYLGQTFPVPIEVIPAAKDDLLTELEDYGEPELRRGNGNLFRTDSDNLIIDVKLEERFPSRQLREIEDSLNNLDGVVENGLFVHRKADVVFAGTKSGVKVRQNEKIT